jgi:RNA polymerase sigma-70 factor (ECF subfamily)
MSRFRASRGRPSPVADTDPADELLLSRHVDGDADAFGELVRRHRDRLWAVALRTLGDPEEAADAVQDALISAFRRAHTFRGDAAVTTWLHRIVVNACLDRVRRRQVRPTVPLADQETEEAPSGVLATSPDHAPEGELRLDVAAALAQLPFEQRAALVLVDMQGYSVEDAARILDVAVGTIKSRCARGRARLLPYLAHLRPPAAADAAAATARQWPGRSATGSFARGLEGPGPLAEGAVRPPGHLRSKLPGTTDGDGQNQDPQLTEPVIGRNPKATAPVKPASAKPSVVTPEVTGASGSVPIEGGDHDRAP